MSIKYGEYFIMQTVYIFLTILGIFIALAYLKNPTDLRMLFIIGFGTWIALILFIIILIGASKAGFIRDPSSVWFLPKMLNTLCGIAYYVCTLNGHS